MASTTKVLDQKEDAIAQLKLYLDENSPFQLDGKDKGYNEIVPLRQDAYQKWTQQMEAAVKSGDQNNARQLLQEIQLFLSIDRTLTSLMRSTYHFSKESLKKIKELAAIIYQCIKQDKLNYADWINLSKLMKDLIFTKKQWHDRHEWIGRVVVTVYDRAMNYLNTRETIKKTIAKTRELLSRHPADSKDSSFGPTAALSFPLLTKYCDECQYLLSELNSISEDPEETEILEQMKEALEEFERQNTENFNLVQNFTLAFEGLTRHDPELAAELNPKKDEILQRMRDHNKISVDVSTSNFLYHIDSLIQQLLFHYRMFVFKKFIVKTNEAKLPELPLYQEIHSMIDKKLYQSSKLFL